MSIYVVRHLLCSKILILSFGRLSEFLHALGDFVMFAKLNYAYVIAAKFKRI